MRAEDFDYELPPELIAQEPASTREASRLMVLDRLSGTIRHQLFPDLVQYVKPGDLLVVNDSKVIPARLRGTNPLTGGRFEILLLEETGPEQWWVMLKPGKRARVGTRITILNSNAEPSGFAATVGAVNAEGHRHVTFSGPGTLHSILDSIGEVPLPPYIQRKDRSRQEHDRLRYQTVYAKHPGSVAAPTAGLHFTGTLLTELERRGVRVANVTLHVGPGTFAPVKAEHLKDHRMHEERYVVPKQSAQAVEQTQRSGGRVIAVGTTSLRVLESAAETLSSSDGYQGTTSLFVYPPYKFKVVDALITNFHLPRATLLMLVSAFAQPGGTGGVEFVRRAYAEAIKERYRFFSYGDAMLIL